MEKRIDMLTMDYLPSKLLPTDGMESVLAT
jgi:hypothetical protein